jgi:exopolysaccharide production protein ExoQ
VPTRMREPSLLAKLRVERKWGDWVERVSDAVFVALVLLLGNFRSYGPSNLFPSVAFPFGDAWVEWEMWILAILLMSSLLWTRRLIGSYLEVWRRQHVLAAFVLLSLVSVAWSANRAVTIHRSGVLLFATLAATYLGIRYSRLEFLRILFWFLVSIMAASLWQVFLRPGIGTDDNLRGVWRGVFWHKNHLGSMLAIFLLVYLVLALRGRIAEARQEVIFGWPLALLAGYMLYRADAAAAILVSAALSIAVVVVAIWLRIFQRLTHAHYAAGLVAALTGLILVVTKAEAIFGLLNRNTTLTGRTSLWPILLVEVVPVHPWLGAGFGATWASWGFRLDMKRQLGWPHPVVIGDDGFLDILLNLGFVGLVLFLLLYFGLWRLSLRRAVAERTMTAFFAPLFMLYSLLANLTYSLLFEIEILVWTAMIVLLAQLARREALEERATAIDLQTSLETSKPSDA